MILMEFDQGCSIRRRNIGDAGIGDQQRIGDPLLRAVVIDGIDHRRGCGRAGADAFVDLIGDELASQTGQIRGLVHAGAVEGRAEALSIELTGFVEKGRRCLEGMAQYVVRRAQTQGPPQTGEQGLSHHLVQDLLGQAHLFGELLRELRPEGAGHPLQLALIFAAIFTKRDLCAADLGHDRVFRLPTEHIVDAP